ncbi:hypothetical protein AB8965_15350 [Yersinia enterocolitica]|uniref:hypothetical protein n=1 Tax=Yersinia enterocolitica TaxID=630 RepID=UPI0021AE019A|nr:hypothetical protein [Yersinia enterocolitica]
MTITTIHSTLKMAAMISDAKPVAPANTIHQRVAQAWQDNPVGKSSTMEKKESANTPQLSAEERSGIDDFIEKLRTTHDKKALINLVNNKLFSMPVAKRVIFVSALEETLQASASPEDQTLIQEKFNPAYIFHFATTMLADQLNEQSLKEMSRVPSDDDNDDDEI